MKLAQTFEIFLFLADGHFEATARRQCFIYRKPICFGNVVLYAVDASLYPFNPRQPLFSSNRSSPLRLSASFCLIPHLLHTLYTCCIHLAYSPQTKTACLAIFSPLTLFPSPHICHSHCILLIFVSPTSFFFADTVFSSVWNISVSDTR